MGWAERSEGLAYSLLRGCHRGGLTDGVGAAAEYWAGGGRGESYINNLIGVKYMYTCIHVHMYQ